MAELVDALVLGTSVNDVGVRVPSSAQFKDHLQSIKFVGCFFNMKLKYSLSGEEGIFLFEFEILHELFLSYIGDNYI